MALATITTKDLSQGLPTQETVVLTASDTETYLSTKFKKILAAQITINAASSAANGATVTFATNEATISLVGDTSDVLVTLTLFGN